MATTKVAQVIVPEIFANYMVQNSTVKTALFESGAVVMDPLISQYLAGGGSTINIPYWGDLANDAENISTDDDTTDATPANLTSIHLEYPRLSRNKSWSHMALAGDLAGSNPGVRIMDRAAAYWAKRLQALFVATWTGVFADNAASPGGSDTHTQNDMIVDRSSSGTYSAGTTDFSAEHYLDAKQTMGDNSDRLAMVMMHSIVATRAKKNNLIDYIPDSDGRVQLRTFLGDIVIVDDTMPVATNVYSTWLFAAGSTHFGEAPPSTAPDVETQWLPNGGNGGGEERIFTRRDICIAPEGTRYIGAASGGGPANTVLDDAASWSRRVPERKQVGAAQLLTCEHSS